MHKVAFVLGGANTLDDDLWRAMTLCKPDTMIMTNHTARDWPGEVAHMVTLHPELVGGWLEERRAKGLSDPKNLWTSNKKNLPPEFEFHQVESWDGSSGLLSVTIALHLCYDKVVMCGVPLDKNAAHYDCAEIWKDAPRYRHSWLKRRKEMQDKVKSMSGWTQKLLGAPTMDWLND